MPTTTIRRVFKVFIDFDATLFNTDRFADDLWQNIAGAAQLPASRIARDATQFITNQRLGGYDYEAHVASYGLAAERMWRGLDKLLTTHTYFYDDSAAFIQNLRSDGFDPAILSFGETRFQTAKIKSVLNQLTGDEQDSLRFEITMRPKTFHLADMHPNARGVLVDDKPDQQLPPGFTEIHLHHEAGLTMPYETNGVYTVSSLAQARTVVLQIAATVP